MSADVRDLEPVVAPLAIESPPEAPAATPTASALATVSPAELRVQRAKARLTQRLSALDQRARFVAKQTAWVAGMVLLGLAGAAVAGSLLGRAALGGRRGRSERGFSYEERQRRPGVGTALALAALGLIGRRVGRWQPRQGRS